MVNAWTLLYDEMENFEDRYEDTMKKDPVKHSEFWYDYDRNDLDRPNPFVAADASPDTITFTGDIFSSKRCDCGDQLSAALKQIEREGRGVAGRSMPQSFWSHLEHICSSGTHLLWEYQAKPSRILKHQILPKLVRQRIAKPLRHFKHIKTSKYLSNYGHYDHMIT